MFIKEREPGRWEIQYVSKNDVAGLKGLATKFYDAVEAHLGAPINPSAVLTERGLAFWRRRNPELVEFHRPDPLTGLNVSPRFVRELLDNLTTRAIPEAEAQGLSASHLDMLREQRDGLQQIWDELPPEAKTERRLRELFAVKREPEVFTPADDYALAEREAEFATLVESCKV